MRAMIAIWIISVSAFIVGVSASSCPKSTEKPIIVIGGGISGVAAAADLHAKGCAVVLIEAKEHLGGRTYGEVQPGGWVFNHGANWIHGASPNPIWDFNQEHKLMRTQWLPRTYYTRTENGVTHDSGNDSYVPGQAMRDAFDDYAKQHQHFLRWLSFTCRGEYNAVDLPITYFVREYLRSQNMTGTALEEFLLFYGSYETLDLAVDLYSASMINQFTRSYSHDKEHMVADPYNNIVDFLAKDLSVILGEPVRSVQYTEQGVLVTSRNGRSFNGSLAIVTIPIGVLKTADVVFEPPLPPWKQRAISGMHMGLLEKLFFEFDEPWWEAAGAHEDAFWRLPRFQDDGFKNTASEWYNLHNLLNNTVAPVLCTTPGGYFADLLEYEDDDVVIKHFLGELQGIFPNVTVPWPKRFLRTFHRRDEFMRGSYTSPMVGADPLGMAYLAEPVANRLLFAGEATNTVRFGYVDGAYDTGLRAADEALRMFADGALLPFALKDLTSDVPRDVQRIRAEWRRQVEGVLNISIPHCDSTAVIL